MTFQDILKTIQLIHEDDEIENIELLGNWKDNKTHGYDRKSINMLNNPNQLERIKKKWNKLRYPVDLYILKGPKVHQYNEVGRVDSYFVRDKLGLKDLNFNDESITLILTNNKGDEKVPLTPWTIAHRFGHALARDSINTYSSRMWQGVLKEVNRAFTEIAKEAYGINFKGIYNDRKLALALANTLGTFKSARDNNIRNPLEFVNEIIAQYIITGNVTLNKNLPKILPSKYAWGKPNGPMLITRTDEQKSDLQWLLNHKGELLTQYAEDLLGANIGHIFVM
jgi:hypothetical protein